MSKFLLNLLRFSLLMLVVNAALYAFIVKPALFERYIYNEKPVSDYRCLLLSDSHGAYLEGIPNRYGIFNLSYTSDTYRDMFLKLTYFIKSMSEGDTLFLSFDSHHLSSYRDGSGNIALNIIYSDSYSDVSDEYSPLFFHLIKRVKYIPFFYPDLNKLLLKYLYAAVGLDKPIGKRQTFATMDSVSVKKICSERFAMQFKGKHKSNEQQVYLEKIISLCRKRNVEILGVKFPMVKPYWNMIRGFNFPSDSIASKYGIPIIDLHGVFFDHPEYFRDQDHLNLMGSYEFCRELDVCRRSLIGLDSVGLDNIIFPDNEY